MQIRCRAEKPGMFDERKAIRHSGNEIGDEARTCASVVTGETLLPFKRKILWTLGVVAEQFTHDPFRIAHDSEDARMMIYARQKEGLDRPIRLDHGG